MNSTAQDELSQIDLAKVLQFGWSDEELSERLREVFNEGFSDLLDSLSDELEPEQFESFAALLSKEGITPDEIQDVFTAVFPQYGEKVKNLALEQKSNLITSYVELLRVSYSDEPLVLSMLDDISRMIADEEWSAVGEALAKLQKAE